ncbi:Rib/alpha-like domain-containing protein [Lactobacillus johnsonii]|uniref:YSIRK-type signal peptide-containing protein n=1 Tax=Lactobacillus johnsonii TaxID=33959 RepID=A0A9X7T4Z3_LACJH|nr:Rib/alpha-like domain-containing protein [Lactobacillus johnsonii]QIA88149.1 YSIRK-type signal peptide-containing protein [Lactobacillus johnsonii]
MLSRNNYQEKIRKMENKKERFSIRKFSIGAASVLIGFTLFGIGVDSQSVKADTVTPNSVNVKNGSEVNKTAEVLSNEKGKNATNTAVNSTVKSQNTVVNTVKAPAAVQTKVNNNTTNNTSQETLNKSVANSQTENSEKTNLTASNQNNAVKPIVQKANVQATNNQTESVNDYSQFLNALQNKNVSTITLDKNIDFSNANLNNGSYQDINNYGIARTVTIDGQKQYSLNMGGNYIDLDSNTYYEPNASNPTRNWNVILKDLNLQTTSGYGPFWFNSATSNDSTLTFNGVTTSKDSGQLLNNSTASSYPNVNVNFEGENKLQGNLTNSNITSSALIQANNVNFSNGSTVFTANNNSSSNLADILASGNVVVDSSAQVDFNSEATSNMAGVSFANGAGNQTIDNATSGVLRLMPNAQVTMELGSGDSMGVNNASNLDLQDSASLKITTSKMNSTGFRSAGLVGLDYDGDTNDSTVRISPNAVLSIIRTKVTDSDAPLLAMGPSSGDGEIYHLEVNDGSLNLQDSAYSSYLPSSYTLSKSQYWGGWPAILTMWGTSSQNYINFNNAKLINLQRTALNKPGYLIKTEGAGDYAYHQTHIVINSPDSAYNTPLTIIPAGETKPVTWNVKYLNNTSQGGDYAYAFRSYRDFGDWNNAGSEYMNGSVNDDTPAKGVNEVTLTAMASDSGSNSFSNGAVVPEGNETTASKALNSFINHFSWWNASGVKFGSNLDESNQYTPSYKPVNVEQGQTAIDDPSFTNQDGKDITAPAGTTFTTDTDTPDWATINSSTGTVTVKPGTDVTPGAYNIPVTVTYPDTSTSETTVPVIVTKAGQTVTWGDNGAVVTSVDTSKLNAHETTENSQVLSPVGIVTAEGYELTDGKLSTTATPITIAPSTVSWTTTPDTNVATAIASGKDITTSVNVDFTDNDATKNILGSKNGVVTTNPFTIDAKGAGAKAVTAPVNIVLGSDLTSEQFSQLVDNNIPTDEIAKTEWATKPNAQGQDGVIKITFTDKDANGQPTYLNINIPASSIKITTDADKYTPEGQDINTKTGVVPAAAEGIKNKSDLPSDTKYTWKTTPDVTTAGNKPATVVVTYPDGSKDEVPVTVHVTNPTTSTDADKYKPEGQDVNTKTGVVPSAAEGIKNKSDLPSGTKYTWKTTPDVTTTGNKPATVVVTYPDGSKDEVPVTVHVTNPTTSTDADKYKPEGQDVNTKTGVVPAAEEGIANKSDLPSGTKYTWKTTPDVTTAGNKPATVVVTYPDGSTTEVPVTIHVTSPETDADKYKPEGQDVNTKTGVVPAAEEGIKNKSDLPSGTKYTWKTTPDVTTAGNKPATVVVTYPDGSTTEVPVTVHVTSPETDADKYKPEGQDVNTKTGVVPAAEEGIANKSDLPSGTKYTWKTTPDVTTAGNKPATVVVTYPDGSTTEVPVTVHVTSPETDADKYKPEGQDVNTKTGVVPSTADGIKNKSDLPSGTKYTWKTTPDVTTTGNKPATVVVTYPDGSKDEVPVTVHVTNPTTSTDADKYKPEGQDVNTKTGVVPAAEEGIANKSDLPSGTKYTWKTTPDVTTAGNKPATVVVTYPDGSTTEVPVTIHVTSPETDADKYKPEGQDVNTKTGVVPAAEEGIKNKSDLPSGTKYTWKTTPDVTTAGNKPATVVVTYPDGSTTEVPVTVHVTSPETDADKYKPEGQDVNTKTGVVPAAEEGIANKSDLPSGTKYTWKTTPDVTTAGNKPATVVVTYPDGSTTEVPVTVHVTSPETDADKYKPEGQDVNTKTGVVPSTADGIKNKSDLPSGTKYTWKTTPDVTTTGNKPATVVVTYPDGSKDEVPVTVHVTSPETDADKYKPEGQDVNTKTGVVPSAADGIKNKSDLLSGTKYTWKDTPDVTTTGNKPATVVVTYPDGSKDEVPVTVHVTNPSTSTDADKYKPEGQNVNTKTGVVPAAEEGIKNKSDLPSGTKYTWKDTPDVTTTGNKPATVVVTYPDGSKDEVPVTIHVTSPSTSTDADKYKPEGQDVNTKTGVAPAAAEGIKNKSDLPSSTKYTWKDTPDVTTAGNKPATVVVTYPDGSKDEVPVTVHVTTPTTPTDADKYTPKGQDVDTKTGVVPNPAEGIKNKGDLPDGTKYTWKDTPDVTTAGDKPATVVVTYPDGSKDEVPVTVHVTTPTTPTDADKYTPEGQDVNTKTGVVPNPAEGIKNKGDLPDGTKYTWKDTPDVTTAGDKPATVVVTYPDGSKDEVPVTVHVTTPTTPTDADKYTPEGQDVNTKTGVVPNPAEGIKNKGDLPDGTKYTWKDTPDVTTAGDKPATVVVTYPDGSKDEVPVTVHVTTPTTPTDADKYTPEGQDVNTKTGVVPNPAEGIKNKGDLPDGTKYTWKDTPDVTTAGDKPATVVVTYPDGSKDEVPVTVHVTNPATPTDADKYTPKGQDVDTKTGVVPNPAEGIKNKGDLPDGTKYTWKDTPDVTTAGDKPATIVVIYPDGSKDEVPVTIHVTNPTTDADKYTPEGQDVNTKTGVVPDPAEGIKNKGDLPDGTKYTWKDTPDVTTAGDKPATVVVTYPDGSKDEVPVTIHVTNPATPTDADKYTPEGQDVNTKTGVVPNPAEGIKNKGDLPDGTKYTWKDTPDVTTAGESTGVIVVTYPDGSKDEVPVTIHVTNPATPTDADKYTPEGQDVNTKTGVVPNPAEGIKNKSDLPDGTKYTWEKTPDVTKPGESTGVIVVTYPDGSKDEVTVKVIVNTNNVTPETQPIHTTPGVLPNPADAIKNKDEMPAGTKYTWKEVPNVNTVGEHTGVITVTYPDGSSVDLTVKVYVDVVAKENNSKNTAQVITKPVAENNEKKTSATPAQQIKHSEKATLPQTGAKSENTAGILGLAIAAVGSLFGLGAGKKRRDK